jgi:hypothetical protein
MTQNLMMSSGINENSRDPAENPQEENNPSGVELEGAENSLNI